MSTAEPTIPNNSIAVINRSGPFSNHSAQESLDFVMAMANFGQELSVFFIDDGVYQLLNTLQAAEINRKNFTKGFAALHFYDIDKLYVCSQSLVKRGLSAEKLSAPVVTVSPEQIAALLASQQHVVTF